MYAKQSRSDIAEASVNNLLSPSSFGEIIEIRELPILSYRPDKHLLCPDHAIL
jgi:hypothetical protein